MTKEDVLEKRKICDKAETDLIQLRDKIKTLEAKAERTQNKITNMVKGYVFSGETKGGVKNEDQIIELKKDLAAIESLSVTLRGDGITQAEQALRNANKALSDSVQQYIGELREERLAEARVILHTVVEIGLKWFVDVDELLKGLQVQLPSFLVEDCRKIFLFKGVAGDQSQHVKEMLGL
jgi:hypothetical protein